MKLFFDGGWRPATGMETAVVIGGRHHVEQAGPGNAMDAEWLALIRAATIARDLGIADPVLIGDAAAVIAQAAGTVRCPPSCINHHRRFHAVAASLPKWRLRHVKRSHNLAGIALARLHPR
ncbi:reverse transcriptase-like protein [Sphingomonas rubra]|uniref:Ribonuclease HI n=1 Tax=Sphingomonas rubra TaxID=634430 RepID=A0A1I5RRC1_9SPHN|nr:reverse transcriptase-like protein [Sphingomonas rubra]SFP60801.1 ribonuclease HI [Sphingomonas rubra]